MNIIETHDLSKIYQTGLKKGNITALDSVSLTVSQGEIFGLLGPNGAGKTTLVKILLGLTRASSGESFLSGLSPDDPISREKVGFLQENPRFPFHLTGSGLLRSAGELNGLCPADTLNRVAELLELVGMSKWGTTQIRKYSKGMNERIGLAQALINDPDIIFLDEPTDGIDPIGRIEIRKVLLKLRDQGKTIFLNSHLLSEVEQVADRVGILSQGQLIKVASVEELTTKNSQFEIEATIGNERIDIPEEMGQRLMISSDKLVVLLNDAKDINKVIDELRLRRIEIRSVTPAKRSLEQSFIEAVSTQQEVGK